MERPNILMVTVDSMRADHLTPYGYGIDTSPNMDAFAKESWVFDNAYAVGPNTHPSFPALLTSTYPNLFPRGEVSGYLESERVTLAQIMQKAGYSTGGFHSNPFLSRFYGYQRGFDAFDDFLITERARSVDPGTEGLKLKLKRIWDLLVERKPPFARANQVNKSALKWLDKVEGPFFMWTHYMDVHMPYLPPKGYLGTIGRPGVPYFSQLMLGNQLTNTKKRNNMSRSDIQRSMDLYDASIRYTDKAIGNLVKNVRRKSKTPLIVIITSDHGEEFMDHNGMGHGQRLYEELVRVPLIIMMPGGRPKRVDKVVSHIDVPPFLLQMTGMNAPDSFQGVGILERMTGEFKGPVFFETLNKGRPLNGIRNGQYKFINYGKGLLFDLYKDPNERMDIASSEPKIARELMDQIETHVTNNTKHARKLRLDADTERVKRTVKANLGRI